jgi:uncharacterized OB-fold protein
LSGGGELEKFVAFKCKACGKLMLPRHERCLGCREEEFEEVELPKEGTLTTYTKLYFPPEGIEMPPLTLGIAEFGGVRVLGQVMTDEPAVGMRVEPVWGVLRKLRGKEIQGFKFRPVGEVK